MPIAQTPLYVRLAENQARRLEAAVTVSGKTKRQLIEDAVSDRFTDEGLIVGRGASHEEDPEVLTSAEAAAFLRLAETGLVEAAARDEVPGRLIAGEWRFSRVGLLDWLRAIG